MSEQEQEGQSGGVPNVSEGAKSGLGEPLNETAESGPGLPEETAGEEQDSDEEDEDEEQQ